MKRVRALAVILALVAGLRAAPAEPAAPAAGVFFSPPVFRSPRISPDGRRLAALTLHDGRRYALILTEPESGKTEVLIKEAALTVRDFVWKADDLILVVLENDAGFQAFRSIDLRTHQLNRLDPLNDGGWGPGPTFETMVFASSAYNARFNVYSFLLRFRPMEPRLENDLTSRSLASTLPDDPAHVLAPWPDGTLRLADARTGKGRVIEKSVYGITRWIPHADAVWAGVGYHDEKWTFVWRTDPKAPWQQRDQPGIRQAEIYPLAVMPDHRQLVVLDRRSGDTVALASFDLASGKTTEIHRDPNLDVEGVLTWGHRNEPCAAISNGDRQALHFFRPDAESTYKAVAAALPDTDFQLTSFDAADRRVVVTTTGDRDPGRYFLLDRTTGRLTGIGAAQSTLTSSMLAPSRAFRFTSRDGLAITGRVTLPEKIERPPLIVRVGPGLVGPRALNAYDPVAQFLASRGFASVRVNVRGTPGFGAAFARAGDLQLATGMVHDLEDAVAWLAGQGWVDGRRAAILGEQGGGIVAVHAAVRGPFRALVNFNTPMVTRQLELEQLSPSDRDNRELTALLGSSGAALAHLKSLDPLKAAAQWRVPSFHAYPRTLSGEELVESGRLLSGVLRKSGAPFVFYDPPRRREPERDPTRELAERYQAAVEFLRERL